MKANLIPWKPFSIGFFLLFSQLFSSAQCHISFIVQSDSVANHTIVYFAFGASAGNYKWSFGDGSPDTTIHNTNRVNHTYATPGNYTLCITEWDSTGSCYDSLCRVVHIYCGIHAQFNYNLYNSNSGDDDTLVMFNYSNSLYYHWNLSEYSTGSGSWNLVSQSSSFSPSFTISPDSTYQVCLTVWDSGACADSLCKTFKDAVPTATDTLCGLVFNDANGNGIFDLGESTIPGAEVLVDGIPRYTDTTGFYHAAVFPGSHTISVVIPGGWQQTYPVNPSFYSVSTAGNSNICGFDFGLYLQSVQNTNCYSFDDITVPSANQQQAFNIYGNGNGGFLNDWRVTSGTPNIEPSGGIAGLNAYDGNQFAMIAVCQDAVDYSEGFSLQHSFLPGQSYQVSMAIRNTSIVGGSPTPIDINFILLQNAISYAYNANTGCSATPAIPAGSLTVNSITNFAQNSWSLISFTISNLTNPYAQLWLRVNFTNGPNHPSTALCIDSVCVQPIATPTTSDCYSFDDTTVPTANQQQAFNIYGNGNPGFLQDWFVTCGTPNIEPSGAIAGLNAYSGNQFGMMAVCQDVVDYSEGVSLHHNFVPGQSYQVSMAIRNTSIVGGSPTPIDLNFILLQNAIAYPYNAHTGCSQTPAIPAGSLVVNSITNYAQNSWSVISFTISNLSVPYTQLWFRVNFTNGPNQPSTALCFDSVCIEPVTTDCYSFDDTTVPSANQQQAFNIYGNGNPGFLQDWNVTCGTPSIEPSGGLAGLNAYSGNQFSLMAICQSSTDYSEGVSLHHNFVPGQSYRVSMAILNTSIVGGSPSPIDINYILLQNPISYPYNAHTGCSATPAIPAGSLTVSSITNFAQNTWSVISFTISNLTVPYTQLWFRATFTNGPNQPSTALCFDSVCIEPLPPTSDCYSFDDTTVPLANQQQAFNIYGNGHPGFLQDWSVPSGTPSIQTSGEFAGVNAYDGNQYALLAVCYEDSGLSEGVSLHHNFVQGQSYKVSMAIRNAPITGSSPAPIDVNYILLNSPVQYGYNAHTGCSPTPPVPTGATTVYSVSNYAQNYWTVISFIINHLNSNYSELWFRVGFTNGFSGNSTAFCFDSVCIRDFGSLNLLLDIPEIPLEATDRPALYQNNLNPFSGETTIRYYLPETENADARILVHDITGKLIKEYPLKHSGNGEVVFDAGYLSPGVYLYSLIVNNRKIDTKRMLLVR